MTARAPTAQTKNSALKEAGWVVLAALLPSAPLWLGAGMVNTRAGGDSPFLLIRVHQLVSNLQSGVFPARWMPDAAYGLGFPFFQFYASLPFYLAAILKLLGLGYILAIQLTQTLGFVLAALAIYGYSRELRLGRWASLLAAVAYSCAPFHMVNVYVRGDSLSEFYAFVFFPLVAWTLLRIQRYGRARDVAWAAAAFAGLWLTHNLSAMTFTPFAVAYALWLAWERRVGRLPTLAKQILALVGGMGVSAWFWLPLIAERPFVHLKDMTSGYFHYAAHFRGLDLVQPSAWFDYAITAVQQPFRMGLLQATLALAGLGALVLASLRRSRNALAFIPLGLLTMIATFMITPWSGAIWQRIPLLPLVQFPWRFLSIQALGISVLIGVLAAWTTREKATAFILGLLITASALIALQPERLAIHESDVSLQRLMDYEYFTANIGTTIRADYLPRWVDPRPLTSEVLYNQGQKAAPLVLEGGPVETTLLAQGPTNEHWQVSASSSALLAFHTYFFPGWSATVDGQRAALDAIPGLGYISLRVGPGAHDIQLHLQATRIQSIALLLSGLSLCACVAAGLWGTRFTRRQAYVALLLCFVAAALLVASWWFANSAQSVSADWCSSPGQPLDLSMDFDRMPYLHHNPGGLLFGDHARLAQYRLSGEDIRAGTPLTVTTEWHEIPRNASVQLDIVSPARHLLGVPLSIATSRNALDREALSQALTIPLDTVRGIYLLALHVYEGEQELLPHTLRGDRLATTYLVPIRIREAGAAQPAGPVLQPFGDRIFLTSAQTRQSSADSMEVELTWRTSASPTQNYRIALRLRDPSGWELARLDTEPGYGFFPTSMWRPGMTIADRYALPLDAGTPPSTHYVLDITLYESSSLRQTGTVRVSGVTVAQPSVGPPPALVHRFGPSLGLTRSSIHGDTWQPGDRLWLVTDWTALATMDRDYGYRLSLLNASGAETTRQEVPIAPEFPTSRWPKHALVSSRASLSLPTELPPGTYRLALTALDLSSGQQLGSASIPQTVTIVPSQRSFVIPEMQKPIGADFQGQVRLLGYDLERSAQKLAVTLYWQGLAAMSTDYKVFLHFFDPATERIAAQQDVLAGTELAPSSTWVPQQVVTHAIELSLDRVVPGAYDLGVGLYHGENRLGIVAPAGWTVSSDRLLLVKGLPVP